MKTVITNKPLTQTWVTVNEGKVTGEYGSRDKARAAKTGTVAKAQELNVIVQVQIPEKRQKRKYNKNTEEKHHVPAVRLKRRCR